MGYILIYGSYGYTGNLIAERASDTSMPVLLGGRDSRKLEAQSRRLGLNFRTALLDSPGQMDKLLQNVSVVIHCAGPFIHTWKPMSEACLRNGCHYLDITGEIPVFESLKTLGERFKQKKLMAMPGTGFDVVPTDCLAAFLHERMPDAINLELAFRSFRSGISRGTAKTMIEYTGGGGLIRKNGKLVKVKAVYSTKTISLSGKNIRVVSIPWGDISTAYSTTGIPNITVYMSATSGMIFGMKVIRLLTPVLRTSVMKNMLKLWIDKMPPGPGEYERAGGRSQIWGRVENKSGNIVEAEMETREGYSLTAEMTWMIACKVLQGEIKPGYQTPAGVYGWNLVFESEKTRWIKD
jgi:short subunit dehydrogenase-like uncharacterized protein